MVDSILHGIHEANTSNIIKLRDINRISMALKHLIMVNPHVLWNMSTPADSNHAKCEITILLVCLKMLCTPKPNVLLIIIPMKNGYFIGNINPTFSDIPILLVVSLTKSAGTPHLWRFFFPLTFPLNLTWSRLRVFDAIAHDCQINLGGLTPSVIGLMFTT